MSRPAGSDRVLTARLVLPVLTLLLLLLVGLLPAPYVVERPGPVIDTLGSTTVGGGREPVIDVPGRRTYPTTGRLDLLTVSVLGGPSGGPNWLDLARAWLDPAESVVPAEEVYPQGATQRQLDQESGLQMTDSQQSAAAAALRELGYRVPSTVEVAQID